MAHHKCRRPKNRRAGCLMCKPWKANSGHHPDPVAVERQLQVPITYKGKRLGTPLRLDLKVNGLVLVDNKAVTEWNTIFEAQMLTYLRLTKLKLGLVINFGEQYVKNGIHRVVNGL